MRDLEPYICVLPECTKPQELFSDIHDWTLHMQRHLPAQWECIAQIHDAKVFNDPDSYMRHVKNDHPGSFTDSQIQDLTQINAHLDTQVLSNCPFCNAFPNVDSRLDVQSIPGQLDLQKHVATHLKSLALKSLEGLYQSPDEPPSSSSLSSEDDNRPLEYRISVDNLSWQITSQKLKEAFIRYAPIEAEIVLDKETGRSSGFGYVKSVPFFNWMFHLLNDVLRLSSGELADKAIHDWNYQDLDGRQVRVRRAGGPRIDIAGASVELWPKSSVST